MAVDVHTVSLRSGEVTAVPSAGDPRPERPNWQNHAGCIGEDQAIFFPSEKSKAVAAKKICVGCPVRVECLEYAIGLNIQHGVWGGKSIHERRKIRKARYRARLASTPETTASVSGVVPSVARESRPAPPASQAPRATHNT
jgi:WhiB family redox-sensing transcriptional regulator